MKVIMSSGWGDVWVFPDSIDVGQLVNMFSHAQSVRAVFAKNDTDPRFIIKNNDGLKFEIVPDFFVGKEPEHVATERRLVQIEREKKKLIEELEALLVKTKQEVGDGKSEQTTGS